MCVCVWHASFTFKISNESYRRTNKRTTTEKKIIIIMIIVDWVISNSIVSKKKASRSVFLLFSSFFLSHFYLPVYFFLPSKYTPSFDGWLLTQSIWCTRARLRYTNARNVLFVKILFNSKFMILAIFDSNIQTHTQKKNIRSNIFIVKKKNMNAKTSFVCLFVWHLNQE